MTNKRAIIEHNLKVMLKHIHRYLEPDIKKHVYPDELDALWNIEEELLYLVDIIETDRICTDLFLSGVPIRPEDMLP